MGKKIDGFVLSAAAAAGLYFYFYSAFHSRIAAIGLALVSFAVLRRSLQLLSGVFSRFGWLKKRRLRRQAGGALLRLALMDEKEAEAGLRALVSRAYPGDYAFTLVQQHPSARLGPERLFESWRAHRGEEKLVVCATCPAEAELRVMLPSLSAPRVALVDANALAQLIAEHPEGFFAPRERGVRAGLRLRHAASLLFNRKNAPRSLLLSASLIAMYLLTAKPGCLVSGAALAAVALASLRRPPRPAKLF